METSLVKLYGKCRKSFKFTIIYNFAINRFYMNSPTFSSQLLEEAVEQFAKLPGIGRKTALRMALFLLKQPIEDVNLFSASISRLRNEIKFCMICSNLSDADVCPICNDKQRDNSLVCVVENAKDVLSIENTGQYHGVYHVLGGIISPMEGIGPADLRIEQLEQRVAEGTIKEIIFAFSATAEGDTTSFYLYRRLSRFSVQISSIARGVAIGDELDYTDTVTLGRSIQNRLPFEVKQNK